MQILHPFAGALHEYAKKLDDPHRYRPSSCPLCESKKPLIAHGFYRRTLVEEGFDGTLRVMAYGDCCSTEIRFAWETAGNGRKRQFLSAASLAKPVKDRFCNRRPSWASTHTLEGMRSGETPGTDSSAASPRMKRRAG